jgi:hypothetical protein
VKCGRINNNSRKHEHPNSLARFNTGMSSHLINTIAIESRKKKVNFNYKGANERIYKKDINEDK